MIQVYYGDGKGKTTAAVGAAVRAAGAGMRVLFYQFMKDGSSSELKVLEKVDGIEIKNCSVDTPFLNMETAAEYAAKYAPDVATIKEKALSGDYGMVVLDEVLDAVCLGLLKEKEMLEIMDRLPQGTELVLTGHVYGGCSIDAIKGKADYVTRVVKEKHPYDDGVQARLGIEK